MCLRPQEVNANDFECQPDAVHDKILPSSILESNRIDKSAEESRTPAEELEEGYTSCSNGEGEELDKEC